MTEEHGIVPLAPSPAEFAASLKDAQAKATALTGLVKAQGWSIKIGLSHHLRVEAWITIGRGYGYTASSEVVDILRNPDGIKARSRIIDGNGIIVGGAESFCFADEEGKGDQTIAQLAGMAQTRAVSRAFREILSWVVVLAGYSATPAEEMQGTQLAKDIEAQSDPSMLCPLHGTEWFMKGKMRQLAHPVPGEPWCNKADVEAEVGRTTAPAPTLAPEPPVEPPGASEEPPPEDMPF